MDYGITQSYQNHYGVDRKNSDLTRQLQFASDMRNAQYRQSGSPEKRRGYQGAASPVGGIGLATYQRANPVTALDESEIVSIDTNLHRLKKATLTVTYSGGQPNCRLSIYLDENTNLYHCQIMEGVNIVVDQNLGKGFDEVSPYTIGQLSTLIAAVTGFASSVTGDSTTPAAFIQIVREYDLAVSAFSGIAEYWVQVYSPVGSPFSAAWAARFQSDFENVSTVNVQNNIYFSSGFTEVLKYDGNSIYRAGLPSVASVAGASGGAGAITGTNYLWQAQYIQIDNAGQVIEGNILTSLVLTNLTAEMANVTVANVQAGSGFNTNCAIVAGAQATTNTITVDDGSGGPHTMQVGDTAYFFDSVSASYVERLVTARSSTTITIAGAPVTVADNAVISNNLRIGIYRSKTSGSIPLEFYVVAEVPNNSFAATQVVVDNLTDNALGALVFPVIEERSPPKKGKYISQWNSVMITAANPETPTLVTYSSFEGPEYFPIDSNEIIYGTAAGDPIRGIGASNEVFAIMGINSFGVLTGDIIQNQLRLEIKSEDIGCVAHATIREVGGTLAWLSPKGPRMSTGGQVPRPLGEAQDADGRPSGASRIDPDFLVEEKDVEHQFVPRRSISVFDRKENKYLLFVPAMSVSGGSTYANASSTVYAYDHIRDAWLVWDNINMLGGATNLPVTNELYWSEVAFSSFLSANRSLLYRRHKLNDAWDYADNLQPVGGTDPDAWEYASQWDPLGQPSVLKKFLKVKVFTLEDLDNNNFALDVIQEVDYQRDVFRAEFTLALAGAGYGQSAYGLDPYGDSANNSSTHTLSRDRSRAMRLRFRNNTLHENVILTGWEVEAVTPYRVAIKS